MFSLEIQGQNPPSWSSNIASRHLTNFFPFLYPSLFIFNLFWEFSFGVLKYSLLKLNLSFLFLLMSGYEKYYLIKNNHTMCSWVLGWNDRIKCGLNNKVPNQISYWGEFKLFSYFHFAFSHLLQVYLPNTENILDFLY